MKTLLAPLLGHYLEQFYRDVLYSFIGLTDIFIYY